MSAVLTKRPIAVDLFAGAGGMSLGFEQAGFDVVAAVEVDPVHSAVHAFNFPGTGVICDGVEHVTAARIRKVAGIGNRPVDVVFGGSPCQGFSMIGKRALDDPRNSLVRHFVRLVDELDASAFAFENVKGLTIGKHRAFLEELIAAFEQRGFEVVQPYRVLNAAAFGVPQSRERLFVMGVRRGLHLPVYPQPIARASGSPDRGQGLPEGPSVMDALGDLPDCDAFQELINQDWVKTDLRMPSGYAARLRGLVDDASDFSYPRSGADGLLTCSMRTAHGDESRARFAEASHGRAEPVSRFYKLSPNGVSTTLRAGTGRERGSHTAPRPIHPLHPRCITVREMARLHGYPDWMRFHRTKWHGARQVGNSVPPPLARAVATSIHEALFQGVRPVRPRRSLLPGPVDWLSFDYTQAERFFADRGNDLMPTDQRNHRAA